MNSSTLNYHTSDSNQDKKRQKTSTLKLVVFPIGQLNVAFSINFVQKVIKYTHIYSSGLTEMGIKRLAENNSIVEFIHSNTTNTWGNIGFKPSNVTELDVSMLFAKAIRSINRNESVSELFV